jgi:hypothetical protein
MMSVEWVENECKINGKIFGRIILIGGDRWRAERFLDDGVKLTVAWGTTAEEVKAALVRAAESIS